MSQQRRIVYVCPKCLRMSWELEECHGQPMYECDAGVPGDKRSQPIMTTNGRLVTHAPRWWVDKCLERYRATT